MFVSNNLEILKMIFKGILLLKNLGPYRLLGVRYRREIYPLKKKGAKKKR